MKKNNMVLVSALALFSMFFGAGNLIFPSTLGSMVGDKYLSSIAGFLITAVGIVMLGVVAATKAGGGIEDIAGKLGSKLSYLFGTVILLSIGPLLAIPRTAATTFEVIQASLIPGLNPIISSIIFFAIVLFFVFNPTNIVDNLGRFLTPALITILAIILFKGFTQPLGPIVNTNFENVFGKSFVEGYQTMDALAALVFTSIIIKSFYQKGITDRKEIVSLTIKSAIIASIGLCVIYGGLLYIGATTTTINGSADMSRVERLVFIARGLLGNFGSVAMSLAMALACLTTAIGLTSTVGDFFSKMSKGKISYKTIVIISTLFSAYFAINGVENIIKISVPALLAIYPVAIVLIFLNLFPKTFTKKSTYFAGVIAALLPTFYNLLNYWESLKGTFPESSQSFLWIIPVIIVIIISKIFDKNRG